MTLLRIARAWQGSDAHLLSVVGLFMAMMFVCGCVVGSIIERGRRNRRLWP
jgi:hypothetical protein